MLLANIIQDDLSCQNVSYNHREDSIYEVAVPAELQINNIKPNSYIFGLLKAISAGVMKHCDLCSNYNRCVLNYSVEVEDKKTGEKRNELRNIRVNQIAYNAIDKVALANGCNNYSHNASYNGFLLRKFKLLPFWEWKRDH